jgi:hypothetical protein
MYIYSVFKVNKVSVAWFQGPSVNVLQVSAPSPQSIEKRTYADVRMHLSENKCKKTFFRAKVFDEQPLWWPPGAAGMSPEMNWINQPKLQRRKEAIYNDM